MGLVLAAAVFALNASQGRLDLVYDRDVKDLIAEDAAVRTLADTFLARERGTAIWRHAFEWEHILAMPRGLTRWPLGRASRIIGRLDEHISLLRDQQSQYDAISTSAAGAERDRLIERSQITVCSDADRRRYDDYIVRYESLRDGVNRWIDHHLSWGSDLARWMRAEAVRRESYRTKLAEMYPIDTTQLLANALVVLLVFISIVGAIYAHWRPAWPPSASWWAVASFVVVASAQAAVVNQFVRQLQRRSSRQLSELIGYRFAHLELAAPETAHDAIGWDPPDRLSDAVDTGIPWLLSLRGRSQLCHAAHWVSLIETYPDSRDDWDALARDSLREAKTLLRCVTQVGANPMEQIALARVLLLSARVGFADAREAADEASGLLRAAVDDLASRPKNVRWGMLRNIRATRCWLVGGPYDDDKVGHEVERLERLFEHEHLA